jgi:undecaprenyl-diphosphatase
MTLLLAILAGAIQGLTEFLPISSTGHLIIFENIFGISQKDFGLAFDASLHLGTLLAIVIFFFKDYLKILNLSNRLLVKLAIGTIPAAFFGVLFERQIDTSLRQTWIVAAAFIAFSAVLVLAEKMGKKIQDKESVTLKDSLFIGFFQALALIPGISRSGATISAGLFAGLKREEAARFAFMLSGPIIFTAGFAQFLKTVNNAAIGGGELKLNFFLIGILSSAIFGYLTIKYFLKYLSTRTLYPFVVYRVIVGIILIAMSI